MGFVQRALFTWFILLVFLILLCLRLESRISWNWFLVFIPLWLYDTILITWVVIEIIQRQRIISFRHYEYYVAGILLKIVSQIAVCLKLEYNSIPLYAMMVPVWCLLAMLIVYMATNLQPKPRSIGSNKSSRQTAGGAGASSSS
ncbi:conserved hypothetical protein [Culex quinquefasciatus]|uniref:Transmembrane protein 60 n=3 Tax=Culex pipiens complex TaxID=518105 RepID=B0W2H1_CULQU|nr:transmembrane protein 60 [Culex quinquefasciatus]XP_039428697.1 transmembrane protein 60 [Culex pipiens pallens]EDS29359.1 conserved hypothetical protein [Culex quinquefasciatus]|eukprot:XP_001842970.1 conserved hypothetical protein [Culex quinquefasciatus]